MFSLMDINATPFLSRMPRYRHLRQMDFELSSLALFSITHLHPYSFQLYVSFQQYRNVLCLREHKGDISKGPI